MLTGEDGPSPRAWGLRSMTISPGSVKTVHPHVRGVYRFAKAAAGIVSGPSPRAWGLRPFLCGSTEDIRSIPTCVGFTSPGGSLPGADAVHPHVRGVYGKSNGQFVLLDGPSPRAWGLRLSWAAIVKSAAVHPHVRGVYLHLNVPALPNNRSIPTCVGFTQAATGPHPVPAVHPHVRGVYGSFQTKAIPRQRSIPTCVGFTPPACGPCTHPAGPSPRAWGLH